VIVALLLDLLSFNNHVPLEGVVKDLCLYDLEGICEGIVDVAEDVCRLEVLEEVVFLGVVGGRRRCCPLVGVKAVKAEASVHSSLRQLLI